MATGLFAFGLLIVLASPSRGVLAAHSSPVYVDVADFGRVNGFVDEVQPNRKRVDTYLGIPYARPPTGDRRFRPPEPLPPPSPDNTPEYDASSPPASCYQTIDTAFDKHLVDTWNPNTNMSEDCLYLNIWQPETVRDSAVMVWIYGGGFASGTSTLKLYDGAVLAARGNVVVASMQYRVGPLGFLSLGSDSAAPGNAGLLDQQLALRWIYDHIADFGGNSQHVTIFGESAGAASVGYHLLSPGSEQLFRAGIMQSAAPVAPWAFVEPEEMKERSYKLAELVGCSRDDTIECLREKEPELLIEKQWDVKQVTGIAFHFQPTIDNNFLTKSPLELLKSGEFQQQKNVLLGVNNHEGSYFVLYAFKEQFDPTKPYNENITDEEYRKMVSDLMLVELVSEQLKLGGSSSDVVTDTVADAYSLPCGSEGNTGDKDAARYLLSLDGMFGDVWFKCPVIHMAKAYARQNKSKVYMYAFNHRTTGNPWPPWSGDALHGYEIDHVFGVPYRSDNDNDVHYTPDELALSRRMMTYWTNFAKTGNPNDDGQSSTSWPEYTVDDRQVLVLDTSEVKTQRGLRDRYCQFWSDTVPSLLTATAGATTADGLFSLLLTAVFSLVAVLVV